MTDQVEGTSAGAGLSQVARVVDTFIAPSETFTDIRRSATWWLPFVLISLVSIWFTFAIDRKVGFDQVAETQVQMSPKQSEQLASLTPEARAQQMHYRAVGTRITLYLSPLFVLAFAALGSLILWASFNFGLGAKTTYGQIFCLWMYCEMPHVLKGLVATATLYFGSHEGFDMKEPLGTNIGYYLPDAAVWVRTLLGFADVIGLWVLVLLTLGGAIVAKVKVGHAALVIFGWWLLIVLLSTAGTAAFS